MPTNSEVLQVYGDAPNAFDWYDDDGVTTAYQQGDYQHLHVSVDGAVLTLKRERGEVLSPKIVTWRIGVPVTRVRIDGEEVPFETFPGGMTILPPPFSDSLTIEVN